MADVVQYKLERMVNELEDLERRGLFSALEISEIVKKRRKFEYRLKRRSPLKQDYLAYIDYEKSLDALRLLRKKSAARELKKKGNKMKKSVSDFSGVSRIIEIYRLVTNRFKGDVELWFQYLEFCRQKTNGHLKKVLAELIRFHPKVPGVWIYAAAWEFDQNLNVAAARALMQSGLRACPTSEELWVEYVRMELTYLNKLKARKVALGEGDKMLVHDHRDPEDKKWVEENQELFMALHEETEISETSDSKKFDLFSEQGLSILQTVYSKAIEALPSSFSLRTRLLEIIESTDIAHSEEMHKEIFADMKRDFSNKPKYWDWLARRAASCLECTDPISINSDQLWKSIQVYEEALNTVPMPQMFNLYTKFLMDIIVYRNEVQDPGIFESSGSKINPISHALMVYEKADSMGCITEDLACQHVSLFLELGRIDEARELAEKLCNGKLSDAVSLWVLRLSAEMKCIRTPSKSALLSIFDTLHSVLKKLSIAKAETLWLMAFRFFVDQRRFFDKLLETSLLLLARDGGIDNGFSLSSEIVTFILHRDGISKARELYQRFLALPRPGLAIYRKCIEMEWNLASAGDNDCLANARKLYEAALAAHENDASLWQGYYSMECKMGTSETAAAVHWRARKALKGDIAFLARGNL